MINSRETAPPPGGGWDRGKIVLVSSVWTGFSLVSDSIFSFDPFKPPCISVFGAAVSASGSLSPDPASR